MAIGLNVKIYKYKFNVNFFSLSIFHLVFSCKVLCILHTHIPSPHQSLYGFSNKHNFLKLKVPNIHFSDQLQVIIFIYEVINNCATHSINRVKFVLFVYLILYKIYICTQQFSISIHLIPNWLQYLFSSSKFFLPLALSRVNWL